MKGSFNISVHKNIQILFSILYYINSPIMVMINRPINGMVFSYVF